jgi:TetR/AcrR family transcriptional repressor of nem operon
MKKTTQKKNTRELLLDSAFNSFYMQGYQGANIASILEEVGINKGSMYHYFKSKKELALAVIKERIEHNLIHKYEKVLKEDGSLKSLFEVLKSAPNTLPYGCPLNKMSQEMLYIDDKFKTLLTSVYYSFENLIEKILEKENIPNPSMNAKLIIASYEGALSIYHLNQDKEVFQNILSHLEKKLQRAKNV